MPSIDARLTALAEILRRRAEMQAEPVDELSQSLLDFQEELAALDEADKFALLETLNHPTDGESDGLALTMQDFERMIDDWRSQ